MAIVNKVYGETVEYLRGKVDFYMLRGLLPVARKWPKKIKPPYTEAQALAQQVFGLAATYTSVIYGEILEIWRLSAEGKRQQWTDTFKYLIIRYWKLKGEIPFIVLEYSVVIEGDQIKIDWKVLKTDIDKNEEVLDISTDLMSLTTFQNAREQVFFTLTDDEKTRLCCPYIPLVL